MSGKTKRALVGVALLIMAVAAVRVGRELRGSASVATLRDSVLTLRAAVDSCRADVDSGEAQLHAYARRLDTLRGRVRGMEALDPRGVPADSYDIYMAAFESYNDSAGTWQTRVDSVQAQLARCRQLTESHNTAADSLRRRLLQQQQ